MQNNTSGNNILMIKVPEFYMTFESVNPKQAMHGAIMIPIGILQLGSYIQRSYPEVETHYLDLHLTARQAYLAAYSSTCDSLGDGVGGVMRKEDTDSEFMSQLSNTDVVSPVPDNSNPDDLVANSELPHDFNDVVLRNELSRNLKRLKPRIVAVSCTLNAFADNFHKVTELIKEIYPEALVVAGGHYPSSYPDRIHDDKNVDYYVVGEGEIPFEKFVGDVLKDELPADKRLNQKKCYLEDFNDFPSLEYDKLGVEAYLAMRDTSSIGGDQGRTITLVTSRGCPYKCIYCATHNVWDFGFRAQSAENVFKQVVELKEKYNVDTVVFVDDNFILSKRRTKEFCRLLIKNKVNISWYPNSVLINALDEEMIKLMAQSGCLSLALAVESGVDRIQKMIKKRVKLDHAKKMQECLRREGITIFSLFVLGFPGETKEEIEQTLQFARDLKSDWYIMQIATPLPNTEMYDIAAENNYLPENLVERTGIGNISTPEFSAEYIQEILYDQNFKINFLNNVNYVNEDYEKALQSFEGVARCYPDHFICKYMCWKIYTKQNETKKADNMFRNLELLYKNNHEHNKELIKNYNLSISFDVPTP